VGVVAVGGIVGASLKFPTFFRLKHFDNNDILPV